MEQTKGISYKCKHTSLPSISVGFAIISLS